MLKIINNFFETSVAALNIYDIFIILLFILAVVLSIISGIIVLSSNIKKINVELDKTKNIQTVSEKIIQNRLDLIISKLLNNQKNTESNQEVIDINNATNRNIKHLVSNSSNNLANLPEDNQNNNPNIITLPPPTVVENTENTSNHENVSGFDVINNSKGVNTNNLNEQNVDTNIILSTDKIPENNNYQEDNSIIDSPTETININSNEIPENLFDKSNIQNELTVKIKDVSEDTVNLEISSGNNVYKKNNQYDYESSKTIPLTTASEKQIDNSDNDQENIPEKDTVDTPSGIVLTNKMLNQISNFSNKEKFDLVDYITDDGSYIKCLVNQKLIRINSTELQKQLLIHRIHSEYRYPTDLIETNFPIELYNKSIKKCDVVVFDENNNPYIIAIIVNSKEEKSLKLLHQLLNSSQAPFGIIIDTNKINYYQNTNNDDVEEISNIPAFNSEESSDAININKNSDNSLQNHVVATQKNNLQNPEYYNSPSQNYSTPEDSNYFAKDKYNIYKKNPYSLSDEYKSIIAKYSNMAPNYKNLNFSADNNNMYYNERNNGNISIMHNPRMFSNNLGLNLIKNKFRDQYMYQLKNGYSQLNNEQDYNSRVNNIPYPRNYQNHMPYQGGPNYMSQQYTMNNNAPNRIFNARPMYQGNIMTNPRQQHINQPPFQRNPFMNQMYQVQPPVTPSHIHRMPMFQPPMNNQMYQVQPPVTPSHIHRMPMFQPPMNNQMYQVQPPVIPSPTHRMPMSQPFVTQPMQKKPIKVNNNFRNNISTDNRRKATTVFTSYQAPTFKSNSYLFNK